jgi:hypothetical protein
MAPGYSHSYNLDMSTSATSEASNWHSQVERTTPPQEGLSIQDKAAVLRQSRSKRANTPKSCEQSNKERNLERTCTKKKSTTHGNVYRFISLSFPGSWVISANTTYLCFSFFLFSSFSFLIIPFLVFSFSYEGGWSRVGM